MKACVIGTGRMGQRHIETLIKLNFNIVGIYDPFPEAMTQVSTAFKITSEKCYSNPREMLEKQLPDAVVVASTAPSHADYVVLAAELGTKFILCEKPMATSIVESQRMIDACAKNGARLAINHQQRFNPYCETIKDIVASGELGGLTSMTVGGSNFGLAMNGSHYLELFQYMTNDEIVEVNFWRDEFDNPNPRGSQYDSDLSGQLRAKSKTGKRLFIDLGGDQGHGIHVVYGFQFGQIFIDMLNGFVRIVHRKKEFQADPTTRYGLPAEIRTIQLEPADLIKFTMKMWHSFLNDGNYPTGKACKTVIQALVAAHVSAENNGQTIRLEDISSIEKVYSWA
jgi:predicted dehydrogenase